MKTTGALDFSKFSIKAEWVLQTVTQSCMYLLQINLETRHFLTALTQHSLFSNVSIPYDTVTVHLCYRCHRKWTIKLYNNGFHVKINLLLQGSDYIRQNYTMKPKCWALELMVYKLTLRFQQYYLFLPLSSLMGKKMPKQGIPAFNEYMLCDRNYVMFYSYSLIYSLQQSNKVGSIIIPGWKKMNNWDILTW